MSLRDQFLESIAGEDRREPTTELGRLACAALDASDVFNRVCVSPSATDAEFGQAEAEWLRTTAEFKMAFRGLMLREHGVRPRDAARIWEILQ